MIKDREQHIEFLETISEQNLSDIFDDLDDRQVKEISILVELILDKERSGLDKFFDSISQTLKYIPNFITLTITNKYIDPAVAARITAKLALKQSVSIAKGLPASYIANTAVFMDNEAAAALLFSLPKKNIKLIMAEILQSHALKGLDILAHADNKILKFIQPPKVFFKLKEESLNERRLKVFESLKNQYG